MKSLYLFLILAFLIPSFAAHGAVKGKTHIAGKGNKKASAPKIANAKKGAGKDGANRAGGAVSGAVKKAARAAEEPNAAPRVQKGAREDLIYSGGWRWVYRKKAVNALRAEIERSDTAEEDAMRITLGINPEGGEPLLKEAAQAAMKMKEGGDHLSSEALLGIVRLMREDKGADELKAILPGVPDRAIARLGRLSIGRHYERKGFFPEAHGYYSSLIKEGQREGVDFIGLAASFERARLFFFEVRFDSAKAAFEGVPGLSYPSMDAWLANTLFIKGETPRAWALYEKAGISGGEVGASQVTDPVTLLSVADINLSKGDFRRAREIYGRLYSTFEKDEFLRAFFAMRAGDAHLAEGRRDEALGVYAGEADKGLKGEGRDLMALALAEALSGVPEENYLKGAEALYREASNNRYAASEYALLNLARVEAMLRKYPESMKTIERFRSRHHVSELRRDADELMGNVAFQWIDSLYSAGDYYGVVAVDLKHGGTVPFGRKAETYLKAGRSYLELRLYPDAVNSLKGALRFAREGVREESLVLLSKAYLASNRMSEAEDTMRTFEAGFPESPYRDQMAGLRLKAYYLKGDYLAASRVNVGGTDPETLYMRARSLELSGSVREASQIYSGLLHAWAQRGDGPSLARAYIGWADTNFAMERYRDAAEGYRNSLSMIRDSKERAWPLYRLSLSSAALGKGRAPQKDKEALEELAGVDDVLGRASIELFKKAARPAMTRGGY